MNLQTTIKNLERRGFEVKFFPTREEASDYLTGIIQNTTVGIGGSVTIQQLDIYEKLREHNKVYWYQVEQTDEVLLSATNSKVYITSANGVSETGEIINIDSRGNRVAATLFNKDAVYIVIGINKIEKDYEKALWRARNIASPKNAQRLGKNTPCAIKADKCYDCSSADRICRGLVVLWEKPVSIQKAEVVIIGGNLGL